MPPLFSPSTKEFTKEARKLNFSLFQWLHGYFYLNYPYIYIGNGTGEYRSAKIYIWFTHFFRRLLRLPPKGKPENPMETTIAKNYHGKVLPLEKATQLVSIQQDLEITYPEQVIPFKTARNLILNKPDHIVALNCPCRVVRKDPCLPLDVCLIVGEPFASMIMAQHADKAHWVDSEEAIKILEAEERRGHVHHAFFKDVMLDRFYAICNCCSCCCGAMQAQRNGVPMLISSGYISQVNIDLCRRCGVCARVCPFEAIFMKDDKPFIDEEKCMGCGVCVEHCIQEALSLKLAPQKGVPMEIPGF
ncbi:MAG: 4Fe-4S binding protein [Anaerolineaceae bacterium]|nr:4Fe-4S binding protein [Anaerolineaceae bacterium]